MKTPPAHFTCCPSCGTEKIDLASQKLLCRGCGFTYFFNPTIGTAGFILGPGQTVLLIRRGKDPGKGKLAPPGGFADYGENAEEALSREVREETGLHLTDWTYLISAVNWYTYQEITYPVVDFFYTTTVKENHSLDPCHAETDGAHWHDARQVTAEELAFPSMQKAYRAFLDKLKSSGTAPIHDSGTQPASSSQALPGS